MAKRAMSIRAHVGAEENTLGDLADRKLLGIEEYGYMLKGTSPALPENHDFDVHGDRSDYYGETERVTVSEFIRQSKQDWEHVATTEKRSSTGHFSGAPIVEMRLGDYGEQMDHFNKQVLGLEEPATTPNLGNSKQVAYKDVDDGEDPGGCSGLP